MLFALVIILFLFILFGGVVINSPLLWIFAIVLIVIAFSGRGYGRW